MSAEKHQQLWEKTTTDLMLEKRIKKKKLQIITTQLNKQKSEGSGQANTVSRALHIFHSDRVSTPTQ